SSYDKNIEYDKKSVKKEVVSDQNKSTGKEDVKISRKLIKKGNINYTVNELTKIESSVTLKVKEFGGYVASSNFSADSGNMIIKIPEDKFDDFMLITGNFGKITSKNVGVEDVTQSFYDLDGRVKNKRILQLRLQSYLAQARNIEELIKIEYELNNVTQELESLESNLKNMSELINFSTLTLYFYTPNVNQVYRNFPSLKAGLQNFGYNFVSFLYGLFFVILYILIFGVPIVIILGFIYFITFGKLGFVKKFFKFLSSKK
ncbi:MAG TPA: DUF4349 domain-containing protein, partial [Spirochaetota bacterium]|nr:DUF4349 domain-containing protein [Spirochaetota bacterium]